MIPQALPSAARSRQLQLPAAVRTRSVRRSPAAGPGLPRRSRSQFICRAEVGAGQELPIFPLNVVALPGFYRPLQIFEARYRVLFSTLLGLDADGVEEGLVQTDSPYCGTRRFGMCFVDSGGRLCNVGTVLHIDQFAVLPDGRLYVSCRGEDKFRVTKVVKETPVLVCDVEKLTDHDSDSDTPEAKELAKEVMQLLRDTHKLHHKVVFKKTIDDDEDPLNTIDADDPKETSYFVALTFQDNRLLQQLLLEESSTVSRLKEEKHILEASLKRYAAAAALSFLNDSSSSESSTEAPPPKSSGPE